MLILLLADCWNADIIDVYNRKNDEQRTERNKKRREYFLSNGKRVDDIVRWFVIVLQVIEIWWYGFMQSLILLHAGNNKTEHVSFTSIEIGLNLPFLILKDETEVLE